MLELSTAQVQLVEFAKALPRQSRIPGPQTTRPNHHRLIRPLNKM